VRGPDLIPKGDRSLILAPETAAGNQWQTNAMAARFLQLSDVADELAVSLSQVYHMVRSGELPAIKVGGRGQWRVEREKLEAYIASKYQETATWVRDNPLVGRDHDALD
jgi:excisionase family DNA binding protein